MTFSEFIQQEMTRLHIKSNRKFAEQAGISPQMVNDIINETPRELDVISLSRIAEFTGTPLFLVLKLAFPEVVATELDAELLRYAQMLSKLPADQQQVTFTVIDGFYAKSRDK